MHSLARWTTVLSLVLLVAACAQKEVPRDHFYRLDPGSPTRAFKTPRVDGIVEVARFSAVGLAGQRPLVYSEENNPTQALAYHYHFWEETPGAMLQARMVSYLRAANLARKVVTPDLRVDADYVITGRIQRLERIVGSPSKGILHLEIAVRRSNDDALLQHQIYREETVAEDESVTGVVRALNACLSRAFAKFFEEVGRG